jgi:hypothetical protein
MLEYWPLRPPKTKNLASSPCPALWAQQPASQSSIHFRVQAPWMALDQEHKKIHKGIRVGRRRKNDRKKEEPSEKMKAFASSSDGA